MRSVLERFNEKWELDAAGCWIWTAYKHPNGYGRLGIGTKSINAHRVAYSLFVGEIPNGMLVDHICHVPSCVNPDHLRLATKKQNAEHLLGAISTSKSGVRGVSWSKWAKRWRAHVHHQGRHIHVGYFPEMADANAAVVAKRLELFTHNDMDRVES